MIELEDLGDDDIAQEPHFELKTCDRFWLIVFNLKVWSKSDVIFSKIF